MEDKELKVGVEVMYRYNSRCKWQQGRISGIDTTFKRSVAVEKYEKGSIINWPEVLKMCDNQPAGEMIARNIPNWYFQYWVTPDNITLINWK